MLLLSGLIVLVGLGAMSGALLLATFPELSLGRGSRATAALLGEIRYRLNRWNVVHIERLVMARVERGALISVKSAYLWSTVTIYLAPSDLGPIAGLKLEIEHEVAELIQALAGTPVRTGQSPCYVLNGRPVVRLRADGEVRRGTVRVDGSHDSARAFEPTAALRIADGLA